MCKFNHKAGPTSAGRTTQRLTPSQLAAPFRALGDCLMIIVNGVGTVLHTIISAVMSVCRTIIRFLSCGYCCGGGGGGMRSHRRKPARVI